MSTNKLFVTEFSNSCQKLQSRELVLSIMPGGDVLDFGLGIGVYGWDSERWPESTPTFSTKKIQKKWLKNTQFPRFSNILTKNN